MSADGRYLAFASSASNLVADDNNERSDIFVYDRSTNTMERVVGALGELQWAATEPHISADGRYLAFELYVMGDSYSGSDYSVHLYDRQTQIIEAAYVEQPYKIGLKRESRRPTFSGDGRHVAFDDGGFNPLLGYSERGARVFVATWEPGGSATDLDADGLPDDWEIDHGLDPTMTDSYFDTDGDMLTNLREFELGLNPASQDTDGDGMRDDLELKYDLDPLDPADATKDADYDGYTNREELDAFTDPRDRSSKPASSFSRGILGFLILAYMVIFQPSFEWG